MTLTDHPTAPRPAGPVSDPSRRGAIVAIVVGAVLFLGGPVLGALSLVAPVIGSVEHLAGHPATVTTHLDAGEQLYLLAPVPQLGEVSHEQCTARADDAEATIAFAPASALNVITSGSTHESFASVTASAAGDHTITCDTGVPVATAPPFGLGTFAGTPLWLTAIGVIAAVVGMVLVIVGIVRLSRS